MKNILLTLCALLVILGNSLAGEIEIDSQVFIVKPEQGYFIIKVGEDKGVSVGDGLIVYKKGKKIADAYVIEVRPTVSACKAMNLSPGEEIKAGDNILIVKREEPYAKEPIGYAPHQPQLVERGEDITINVQSLPKVVFFYIKQVLRENGYSIIASSRSAKVIHAQKPIDLSILSELWADALASIDHKIAVTIQMKEEKDSLRLQASFFKEYFKKDRQIKKAVPKDSIYYKELLNILSEIKERSEY